LPKTNKKRNKLTKIPKRVLNELLNAQKPLKSDDLVKNLEVDVRTVRYALKILKDSNYIQRVPNLHDLRTYYYMPLSNANQAVA
jgi:predicted transcriptional regulator